MIALQNTLGRYFTFAVLGLAISAPVSVQGDQDDVVLMWGEQTSGTTTTGIRGFGLDGATISVQGACQMAQMFLFSNLPMETAMYAAMVAELAGADGMEAGQATASALADLRECAFEPDQGYSGDMWLIVTSCSMIMGAGTQWMRWTVPPFSEEASMVALDAATGQAVTVPLETRMKQLQEYEGVAVNKTGKLTGYNVDGPGAQKSVVLSVPELREFTADRYDFNYSGNIEVIPGATASDFMPTVSVNSTGHAWIVPDAPGADVIATFFANFRDHVAPAAGMGSLMAGMMRQMAALTTIGIPVETTQKTQVGAGTMMSSFGADSGESTSEIKRIMVSPNAASGRCARTVLPENVEVVDINAMMAGAGGQPGGNAPGAAGMSGMTPEQQAEAAAAMNQASAAMQDAMDQMTPEQQDMLRNMGIAVPGTAAAAANPAGGAAKSGAPSSDSLMTDNLTQTVQLHLQALGYDVGNTDGTASIETTIAISQFQAEKGMTVTGEVTPQLAGILAAEVDSR
jgi:hypothetical protein